MSKVTGRLFSRVRGELARLLQRLCKMALFSHLACLPDQSFTPPVLEADRAAKICIGILLGNRALWLIFCEPIDRREFLPYQEPR